MKRVPSVVWAAVVFALAYVLLQFGIAPLTGALTKTAAPLPSSLVQMYLAMVALGILLYYSVQEERWESFYRPIVEFLGGQVSGALPVRLARWAVLVLIPLGTGAWAFQRSSAQPEPPADPPGIHFNLPEKYVDLKNPLPWTPENIREGGVVFMKNCAVCHGDAGDGRGLFARAWQPWPGNFRDLGTIAQLDENYLYWRIKEGGPGTPKGTIEYRSSMPIWDGVLNDDEIWKVIMFAYTNAGQKPAKRGE